MPDAVAPGVSSRVRPGSGAAGEQPLVVAMAAAAIVGFSAVHGARLALFGLVPVLASLLWRPGRLPRWITRPAPGILRVAVAAVFLLRAGMTLYPVLDDEKVAGIAVTVGSVLVPLLAAAVLGSRVWSPAQAAVPLSIALVAVASFDPGTRVRWAQVVAAILVLVYLAVVRARVEPPTDERRAWPRLAALTAFAAGAAVLAVFLARLLPWAQPHVENAAAELLNPSFPVAQAGFSPNSRLGDIERLSLSRSIVLRVWTPFPRKLRGRVLTEFDGRSWRVARPGWREMPVAPAGALPDDLARWLAALPGTTFGVAAAADGPAVRTRVAQVMVVADTLFVPAGLALARVAGTHLRADRFGVLEAPADPIGVYGLVNALSPTTPAADPGPDTLAVPADTDPRLRALADELAAGAPAPAAKLSRTLHRLARDCRYSLDVGAFSSRQPVAEFVFDKRRGYCEYFASAAAVLLRLQGVPARYVTGFSMDAVEMVGGHYVVRESDAHAWIDAWIPGRGWVEADPTPSGDYAAVHASREGGWERIAEWFAARWAAAVLALRTGELRRLLGLLAAPVGALAIVAAALVALRLRRIRPARPPVSLDTKWSGDPEVSAVMARVEKLWARHGCARPPYRAPLEHLQRLPPGRLPPALLALSGDVVDCYYRARYGGQPPAPETLRGLARLLDARST